MIHQSVAMALPGWSHSLISGKRRDSKMLGDSDIYVAASKIFPISRQEDLSNAGIRLVIHLGAIATRLVGVSSTEQSVTVN
jgi:hypothetical protein